MAIFVELKHFLRYLGFLKFNIPQAHSIAITLQFGVIFAIICGTSASAAYLILEKDGTMGEQVQCIAAILAYIYCAIVFVAFSLRAQQFLGMIDIIEQRILTREREFNRTMYKKRCNEVENLTIKVKIFLLGIIIALLIVPTTIVSYFNYFVNDMGEESFIRAFPMK